MSYRQLLQTPVPQTKPASPRQVPNSAGGYSFQVDQWGRLDRFLVLGSLSGTYYIDAPDLTKQNLDGLRSCLQADPGRAVAQIVDVSAKGRSFNNDAPLLAFALAVAAGDEARKLAMAQFRTVVRTGSHLFTFVTYYKALGGHWGRSVRHAVADWYLSQDADALAYQVIKYQQRERWSHRDVLRLAHAEPQADSAHATLLTWLVKEVSTTPAPALLTVYQAAKAATTEKEIIGLIQGHRLTWEFVPGPFLGSAAVWRALLPNLPLTALTRNLARLTANGVLAPLSDEVALVTERLGNRAALQKARLHPLSLLNAWKVYTAGHSVKGSLSWTPVQAVADALEEAFLTSFDDVQPTGSRVYWGQDVSGSMSSAVAGKLQVNCAEAGAAMALAFARSESRFYAAGFNHIMQPLQVGKRTSFADLLRQVVRAPFGATDCGLPMLDALEKRIPADLFVVCTDNETYAGTVHPHVALQRYRQQMGIPAKLVVIGMAGNNFSIADPEDGGMLDVVGMDTQVFTLLRQFAGQVETTEE